MSAFNPNQLHIKFIPPASTVRPIEGRKYTLTHSATSAELFLSIGYIYDYSAINLQVRDEVVADWKQSPQGHFFLHGKVFVSGGEFDRQEAKVRLYIFHKAMSQALKGIVNGDHSFFVNHPYLLDCPIYISYQSTYPEFQHFVYYGIPRFFIE
ncbi:hypothetical protein GCM10011391_38060 [Pullulanibacillus camelliae]|uniref:Staygreen protein domain-containing protein n=1 Tax=Pullulanibacillus camelliae TaxID=1707096 RepID=A0A8J2YNL3_9BACL|nr:staygreen family protein [Pullulanibacillus camelliae]GGE55439.1 hypothetical protein GCM10011391_38060 [Pullulanibacillus camelliae]